MADLLATLQSALGDAYRIERELPAGGMSRLVVATDTSAFGRLVVVKVLPPEMVSPQSTARFKREVDVTAHLQHPHVLPVLGAGVREGLLYYIMPYVEGESLRGRLERGDRYPLAGALRLLREVADALAYANGRGVVHRDIKPENILLADGHALVADFGIARGAMSPLEGTLGTATGVSLGTLGYMAPEQLFPSGPVDNRVDIYSLGVVAYELLAGVPPFLATSATALAAAHLNEVPRPLTSVVPTIPAEVSDAVAKALSKDPNDRQQSAAELRDAFESALSILQTGSVLRVAPSPPARRVGRLVLGGALVAAVGVAAAVFLRSESAPVVDPNRVLVAPFNMPEGVDFTSWDGAELWSQTLLNVATRNLDGMGPLTTVDAATVSREWKGRSDAVNTRAHARDYNAGLAVYGDIVKGYGDTLIARAQLLDVASGKTIDSVSVRGPEGRPDQLAAALALGLVDALRAVRQITATPNAGLGSRSPPAVKAFAKGEGFYRNTQWDSALVHYERAFAIDSTFALAYRRAGRSLAWLRTSDDSLSRDYLQRAGALNRNLSPHDSLLLAADSLSASLPSLYGDPSWLPKVRRLFDVLNTAVRLYPSDPEVWFSRGDASYHYGYGPGVGIGDRQELSDFSRAIELNAAFAPAYEHAVELAFSLNLPDTARTYAELYLALNPQREDASTIRVVKQIAEYVASQSAAFDVYIDTVDANLLSSAWLTLRRWADPQETAVQIARVLVKRQHVDGVFPDPRLRLSLELAYRGHAEEAGTLLLQLGDLRNPIVVDYALIGAYPIAKADSMFRFWLDDYAARGSGAFPWWTLPWWNKQRDTATIERIVTMARRASPDTSDAQRRFGAYVSQSARGYLELAKGDSVAALRALRTLPDSLCVGCYQDRLETARLLAGAGELERAALLLDERPNRLLTPTEIPLAFERARVADALQKHSKARDAYSLVANAWSAADTFLRSIVAEATTGATPRPAAARSEDGAR
ncbi:MAG: protein kinase [Gemmatimonadaceae bacterium]